MNNSIVEALENSHNFFVYSKTCYAGAFDNRRSSGTYISSDSIGEHFVTTSHGAFAVVMNSRYGWYNPGGTNGSSQHFDREFFNTVFGDDIREPGRINQDSKEDQAWHVTQCPYCRWCCYELNLLGDPAIKLRARDYMERVSVNDQGGEGNDRSYCPRISGDGQYLAFHSYASNLVPGDTNGQSDVFVYDRNSDTIERVSIANDGEQGNRKSYISSISADGRYVVFGSYASNLVPGDTNGKRDIFVHDRDTDTIERVSIANDGAESNDYSWYPRISADGRYVAFRSEASNLVPGDTNGYYDVFVAAMSLELDDEHGNDASSATPISLNTDIWGNIEVGGDVDFFKFYATAGNDHTIQTSLGTLVDSYIYLYDTDGSTIIAEDDNGGHGQASKILWTCTASGYYYVRVDAYSPSQTGTYSLRVSEAGLQEAPVLTPPGLVLTLLLLLGIGTIGIRKNV